MVILKSGATSDVEVHMALESGKPMYKVIEIRDGSENIGLKDLSIKEAACYLHDLRSNKTKIPANFVMDMLRAALGAKDEA